MICNHREKVSEKKEHRGFVVRVMLRFRFILQTDLNTKKIGKISYLFHGLKYC